MSTEVQAIATGFFGIVFTVTLYQVIRRWLRMMGYGR